MLKMEEVSKCLKELVQLTGPSKFVISWKVAPHPQNINYFLIYLNVSTINDSEILFQTIFSINRNYPPHFELFKEYVEFLKKKYSHMPSLETDSD